jgi:hypothetical protein
MSNTAKVAFVYLTNNPSKTRKNVKKLKQQLSKLDNVELFICGYGTRAAQTEFEGIPFYTWDETQALGLGFLSKHRFDSSGKLIFIPGNADYNHLLFYHQHSEFDYYYFCEDDVVYTGCMSELVTELQTQDAALLCTHKARSFADWKYANMFVFGEYNSDLPKYLAFLPFNRISNEAFKSIIHAYNKGLGGHFEMTYPYIMQTEGLEILDIGGSGEFVTPEFRDKHYSGHSQNGQQFGTFICNPAFFAAGTQTNCLYHPVKAPKEVLFTRWRRLRSIIDYYRSKFFK